MALYLLLEAVIHLTLSLFVLFRERLLAWYLLILKSSEIALQGSLIKHGRLRSIHESRCLWPSSDGRLHRTVSHQGRIFTLLQYGSILSLLCGILRQRDRGNGSTTFWAVWWLVWGLLEGNWALDFQVLGRSSPSVIIWNLTYTWIWIKNVSYSFLFSLKFL